MESRARNLVVLPFGNDSEQPEWLWNTEARSFDVAVLFYHEHVDDKSLLGRETPFSFHHYRNFKWWMVQQLFVDQPSLLSMYDYFFFPDDDVTIGKGEINLLFDLTKKCMLEMAQPALSRNSYKSWKVLLKRRVSGMRYLSAVELMCPLMSSGAVKVLLDTFALTRSGWGLDIVWGEEIRKRFGERSIAVFDIIEATHTKPVGRGELYTKLGTSASAERDAMFNKFNVKARKIYQLSISENNFFQRLKRFRAMRKLVRFSGSPALF